MPTRAERIAAAMLCVASTTALQSPSKFAQRRAATAAPRPDRASTRRFGQLSRMENVQGWPGKSGKWRNYEEVKQCAAGSFGESPRLRRLLHPGTSNRKPNKAETDASSLALALSRGQMANDPTPGSAIDAVASAQIPRATRQRTCFYHAPRRPRRRSCPGCRRRARAS